MDTDGCLPAKLPARARTGLTAGPPRPQRSVALPSALAELAPLAARAPAVLRILSAAHARLLRHTRGRVLSHWFGARVLVLETIGRRSGRLRSTPLVYLRDRGDLVIVAANGGSDRQPAWWLNLQSVGHAVAIIDGERVQVRPRETAGAERNRLWFRFAQHAPIASYQRRTGRALPVVVLTPASAAVGLRLAAPRSASTRRGGLECNTS